MRHSTVHHQPLPLFTASICSLIQLERNSNTPLYQQICEKIREAILSGQLAEGTRLPTECALVKRAGVYWRGRYFTSGGYTFNGPAPC